MSEKKTYRIRPEALALEIEVAPSSHVPDMIHIRVDGMRYIMLGDLGGLVTRIFEPIPEEEDLPGRYWWTPFGIQPDKTMVRTAKRQPNGRIAVYNKAGKLLNTWPPEAFSENYTRIPDPEPPTLMAQVLEQGAEIERLRANVDRLGKDFDLYLDTATTPEPEQPKPVDSTGREVKPGYMIVGQHGDSPSIWTVGEDFSGTCIFGSERGRQFNSLDFGPSSSWVIVWPQEVKS